tara:strand:- start:371 stop:967 length:597 start_codon:yes stop_codon:yes gene_type:complete
MKTHNIPNYPWPFNLDEVCHYAYWENFLSKKECEQIVSMGKIKGLKEGQSSYNNKKYNKYRECLISWLSPDDDLDWLYRRVTDVVNDLNNNYFKFDLYGIIEGLQFTNYKAPSGKFDAHIDKIHKYQTRKLSITIQLSDSKDYEGGEFHLLTGKNPEIFDKTQGKLFAFPSYHLHRVTPVTKGERNALIIWITGPNFK